MRDPAREERRQEKRQAKQERDAQMLSRMGIETSLTSGAPPPAPLTAAQREAQLAAIAEAKRRRLLRDPRPLLLRVCDPAALREG